ncbi:MAG TPA: O-antigen ligase family protein, partial [Planctomycetota bacterium]|nr:O-antigen ligase family protein [Planctomycetota bacterium]
MNEERGSQSSRLPDSPDDRARKARGLWISFLGLWLLTLAHYGAVVPWAVAATALGLALLNALAIFLLPGGIRWSGWARGWMAAVGGIFLLQLLPLGPVLFPATHALRLAHGVPTLMPGTADLFYTLRSLAQFAAYVLTGLLVLRLRDAGLSTAFLLKSLCAILCLEALYGIVQVTLPLAEIPFYGPRPSTDAASGTLVNRNTFGGMMAMGLVTAAALAYSRIAWPSRGRSRLGSGWVWSAVSAILVLGLVLSRSRGGALSAAVGIVLIPFLHKGKGSAIAAIGLIALAAAAAAIADPSVLVERFTRLDPYTIGEDARLRIWSTTLQAGAHQPVLGFGIGTHPHAYHPYQPPDLVQDIRHAHNEYINFFFEGGAIFAIVMLAGLGAWGWRSWRSIQRLSGPDRFLPTAVLCAAAAEAIHSMVDFDCRVTAAGLLFGALVGLGASAGRPEPSPGRRLWAVVTLVALLGGGTLLLPLDTDRWAERALVSDTPEAESLARRVLALCPSHYQAAWVAARSRERRGDLASAARAYGLAADLWPAHPWLQREVASWFWGEWRETGDRACYDRSARSFRRFFTQRPGEVEETMKGLWERSLPKEDLEGLLPPDRPAAWGALASFLASKGEWRKAQDLFDRRVEEIPENRAIFDRFAQALKSGGQWGMEALVRERRLSVYAEPEALAEAARAWLALGVWDKALDRAGQACRIDPARLEWVLLRGEILTARGDPSGALEVYAQAVGMSPQDPAPRFRRAAVCMEAKLFGQAAADYRQILKSLPGDRTAVFGLVQASVADGDGVGARRVLDEWIARNPGDAEAARYRATLEEKGR